MGPTSDWNRTAVQRLIFDAEDTLKALDEALKHTNREELSRALRNGRRALKELAWRRKGFQLTPLSATAMDQMLAKISGRMFAIREKIAYLIRRP